jgi:hypothetical protein
VQSAPDCQVLGDRRAAWWQSAPRLTARPSGGLLSPAAAHRPIRPHRATGPRPGLHVRVRVDPGELIRAPARARICAGSDGQANPAHRPAPASGYTGAGGIRAGDDDLSGVPYQTWGGKRSGRWRTRNTWQTASYRAGGVRCGRPSERGLLDGLPARPPSGGSGSRQAPVSPAPSGRHGGTSCAAHPRRAHRPTARARREQC